MFSVGIATCILVGTHCMLVINGVFCMALLVFRDRGSVGPSKIGVMIVSSLTFFD